MITTRAPGKLYIAGEYAVVAPGQPAVLVAVDRFLTVNLREGRDACRVHSEAYGKLPLTWRHSADGLHIDRDSRPDDYVFAALGVVERLRGERGLPPKLSDLRITSQLDDASGRKFGLGSSAAVAVATVRALGEFYGLDLTHDEVFRLALLATITVSPAASGGDVAASTFGGWIQYAAPDRAVLRTRLEETTISETLADEAWSPHRVRRLHLPHDLQLLVGWTGTPASTERLVDRMQDRQQSDPSTYTGFLDESRQCVEQLVDAFDRDDAPAALAAVGRARRVLRTLKNSSRVDIETERLAALCDAAEAVGAAAKPSGAGGGDCGIVLAPAGTDLAAMLRSWEAHDVRHLTIAPHHAEGEPDA